LRLSITRQQHPKKTVTPLKDSIRQHGIQRLALLHNMRKSSTQSQ
jgi:hypothetical protein